jgi:hypothetical protein
MKLIDAINQSKKQASAPQPEGKEVADAYANDVIIGESDMLYLIAFLLLLK